MTENKFTIILDYDDEIGVKENHSGDVIVLNHRDLNSEQFVAQLVMFLNEQNDAIDKLINDEKYWEEKAIERITWLEKENNELKEKNEQLKQSNEYLQGQLDDYSGVEVDNIELRNENEQLKQQDKINEDCYKKLLQKYDDLKKENEELKETNRNLGDFRNFITEKNASNEKERIELQLQMLRLYNYFENWFEDSMSPNSFSEMWDNVKQDEKWEKR